MPRKVSCSCSCSCSTAEHEHEHEQARSGETTGETRETRARIECIPMLPSVLAYGAVTLVAAFIAAYAGLPSLFAVPIDERGTISVLAGATLAAIIIVGGRRLERFAWYARMADVLRDPVKMLLG